jgi:hypothetical protein
MVSKLRVTFPKSSSLLFFSLTDSCRITVFTEIRRRHPEPSTALGPSLDLVFVCNGEQFVGDQEFFFEQDHHDQFDQGK